MHSIITPAYDLCSSRHCNICLLLQTEKCSGAMPTTPTALQKCNGCQLVLYCNAEHQRLDWPLHRDFCRATQKIISTYKVRHPYQLNGAPSTQSSMERAILQIKYLLTTALGRRLQYHEEEFTSFPAYCAVCFSFRRLKTCQRCQAVSYCSKEHALEDASRHQLSCSFLQLYYCAYKVQTLPPNIITDFYRRVPDLHKTDLYEAFQRATLKRLPVNPTSSLLSYQLFSSAADFSCIGTICYALGFVEMRCYDNATFVIFIVGATIEQELWFRDIHTKFFFLQFSQISNLLLYFIGPEVVGEEKRQICYSFQGLDRTVVYISYRGLFQNFLKNYDVKPSLIIAFNCGFSEHTHCNVKDSKTLTNNFYKKEDTWSAGILEMLQTYDLPIVFTSFTAMEADFDYGVLLRIAQSDRLSIHVQRIFNVKQNPFRDLRPLRNWHISDKEEIYYRNGYVQAVRTSLEY